MYLCTMARIIADRTGRMAGRERQQGGEEKGGSSSSHRFLRQFHLRLIAHQIQARTPAGGSWPSSSLLIARAPQLAGSAEPDPASLQQRAPLAWPML